MGCPKGWVDYEPIGKVIPSTRIVAFKTPLKRELHSETSRDSTKDRFTPQDCMQAVKRCSNGRKRLGLVLNLTFTTKYYNPGDFERYGVHYGAIMCPGHEIPNEELFHQFQRSLYSFFYDYPDRNMVVGVHCTHGINRTGYMIARFLIQCEGWDVEEAITTVGDARGHPIERDNYIAHLNNLHQPSYLFPKIPTAKDIQEKEKKQKKRDSSDMKRNGDDSECASKVESENATNIHNDSLNQTTCSNDYQNNSGENNHILYSTNSQNNTVTESESDERTHFNKESESNNWRELIR
ncbi:RNA/RNP complex-1-interacting phosphatase homolog isoform X1 [Bolinopsis microptera]|uniref:RNA/RNP complex-1-interacting phosphatase homolog isoform X1 n=1 Tax=Bolinopsis microptera TaxID=2820187 RepID=UPI00307A7E1D